MLCLWLWLICAGRPDNGSCARAYLTGPLSPTMIMNIHSCHEQRPKMCKVEYEPLS